MIIIISIVVDVVVVVIETIDPCSLPHNDVSSPNHHHQDIILRICYGGTILMTMTTAMM